MNLILSEITVLLEHLYLKMVRVFKTFEIVALQSGRRPGSPLTIAKTNGDYSQGTGRDGWMKVTRGGLMEILAKKLIQWDFTKGSPIT